MNPIFQERARPVTLPHHTDARGVLLPFDFADLPFVPQRLFVVTGVPAGGVRGRHAHRDSWQLMACLAGHVDVLARYRDESLTVRLDAPGQAILIGPQVWSQQTYHSPDSALLVLASEPYPSTVYLDHWQGIDQAAP